jgi:hypothetical protein
MVPSALDRVRKIAASDKKTRFTSLLHHICDINRLRAAFFAMKSKASAGVDGETWTSYEKNLEENLRGPSERLMHQPIPEQGKWLRSVVDGHYRYYGVPNNTQAQGSFRFQVSRRWWSTLRRRGNRKPIIWARMERHIEKWFSHVQLIILIRSNVIT